MGHDDHTQGLVFSIIGKSRKVRVSAGHARLDCGLRTAARGLAPVKTLVYVCVGMLGMCVCTCVCMCVCMYIGMLGMFVCLLVPP